MRRILVVAVMALGACSPATWKHVDRASLVASTAALALDWRQTRTWSEHGWNISSSDGRGVPGYEANPILGPRPQTGSVDVYFTFAVMTNVAIWLLMPDRYKWIVPSAVVGVEAQAIVGNRQMADFSSTAWMCRSCGF